MKSVLKLGVLANHSPKSMLVAYRSGSAINLQALEFQPPERFKVTRDGDELVIRIRMQESEFLALDIEPGMTEKMSVP